MALLGAGELGNTSKILGPASFASTMDLTFTGVSAVAFDVLALPATGPVLISIFGPPDVALGAFTIPGVADGSFFGVISTAELISRVNIANQAPLQSGELIDNLRFG